MGLGGQQRVVQDLAEARAPDMDVAVCALRRRDLPGVPERFAAAGVPYTALGPSLGDPLRVGRVRSLIRRTRADLVHLHLEYATLLGTLATRSLGEPGPILVASVANDPYRQSLLHRRAGRLLAPRIDAHVTLSQGIRDATLAAYARRPRRVETVRPGIDLARFDRCRADPATVSRYRQGAGRLVGTVARLVPQKALDVLLEATPAILAQAPDTRVLIVGEGPLRAELEQRARTLGIAHAVVFAGYQEDVVSAYRAMDVFVLPSRDEGFGLAFLEAMAAGVPVIGTRVIGSVEAVRDGVTGLLVPAADAPALAQAVVRLFDDPELGRRLAGTAAEWVRDFSRAQAVAQVEALYRDLASQRH